MSKLFRHIIFLFILLLIQTAMANDNLQEVNKLFSKYMLENFKQEVPSKKTMFLFINFRSCGACISESVVAVNSIPESTKYPCKIVACYSTKKKPEVIDLIKNKTILYDKKSAFFNFDISPLEDAIVMTEKGKVTEVLKLNLENLKKCGII